MVHSRSARLAPSCACSVGSAVATTTTSSAAMNAPSPASASVQRLREDLPVTLARRSVGLPPGATSDAAQTCCMSLSPFLRGVTDVSPDRAEARRCEQVGALVVAGAGGKPHDFLADLLGGERGPEVFQERGDVHA